MIKRPDMVKTAERLQPPGSGARKTSKAGLIRHLYFWFNDRPLSDLEGLCDLMFEVSNEDRLRILRKLTKDRMSITSLSRELGITTQEASRHISRLGEVGLAQKDPDGLHSLTSYGELTLRQVRGLEFTSRHRDYFKTHTLAGIPPEFVQRLGELAGSSLIEDVMIAVYSIEKLLREAEEYILNVNTPYIASSFPLIMEAYERGVRGRFLHTRDLALPEEMRDERVRFFDDEKMRRIMSSGLLEERLMEGADLVLYMSESEVAILTFPLEDGGFDFHGFTSREEDARKWCSDLFHHYWERAKPIPSVP